MLELSAMAYVWIKALHIVAVIAWMAGLLYLPRLFVYHCDAEPGSQLSETFKTMERRLLHGITNPAGVLVIILGGLLLLNLDESVWLAGWLITKLILLVLLFAVRALALMAAPIINVKRWSIMAITLFLKFST